MKAEPQPLAPVTPRLLNIKGAAEYLGGISEWTVRSFVADGHLHPVRLPQVGANRSRGENGRRLLFCIRDLDAFIDSRRGQ
jgi:hypothetical protein